METRDLSTTASTLLIVDLGSTLCTPTESASTAEFSTLFPQYIVSFLRTGFYLIMEWERAKERGKKEGARKKGQMKKSGKKGGREEKS